MAIPNQNQVIEVLKTIFDPEIPVDIYELGLIYEVKISAEGMVDIDMTLTSPNCPVAESLPKEVEDKVKEMDRLIDEYIAEAKVVVPLPNPDFDSAKFDPSLIGVQTGGLKMPPVKKASGSKGPPQTVRNESMLGWSGKGMDVSTDSHSMKISSTHAQPFLTNASLNIEGPALLKTRLRSAKPGKTNLQWRTADQKGFPTKGQSKQFSIKGGDWQEIEIKLPVKRVLQHLRIFIPDSKKPFEIDWIEITPVGGKFKQSERWDFGEYHSGK